MDCLASLGKSLRRGLVLSDGSLAPFFMRPISAVICAIVLVAIFMYARKAWRRA